MTTDFFSYDNLTTNPQIQMGVFLSLYKQNKIDATTLGMLIATMEEAK